MGWGSIFGKSGSCWVSYISNPVTPRGTQDVSWGASYLQLCLIFWSVSLKRVVCGALFCGVRELTCVEPSSIPDTILGFQKCIYA